MFGICCHKLYWSLSITFTHLVKMAEHVRLFYHMTAHHSSSATMNSCQNKNRSWPSAVTLLRRWQDFTSPKITKFILPLSMYLLYQLGWRAEFCHVRSQGSPSIRIIKYMQTKWGKNGNMKSRHVPNNSAAEDHDWLIISSTDNQTKANVLKILYVSPLNWSHWSVIIYHIQHSETNWPSYSHNILCIGVSVFLFTVQYAYLSCFTGQ